MNQSGDEQAECPLCMEPFEVDDLNFFPCTCGYQICRFCWHRIRTDENGLCPACRKAYPENPADFKPLSQEQMAKLKAEKRQKEQLRKQKATESRKHLANVRVVQKNLVFVVGLPIRLAEPNVLKKHEYFGKFGKIQKVVINQSTSYAGALGPSASAYVTYNRYEDALRAIQAINNIWVDNRQIKTSLGTTKYCSHFIKAQTCPKSDCMYLHDLGDPEASFTKEEMQRGKHLEYERNLFEQFNYSISQERKTTPSPPALGNSLANSGAENSSNFPTATKEAWLSMQNGGGTTTTTQTNPGGGTVSESAVTTSEVMTNVPTSTSTSSTRLTLVTSSQSVNSTSTKQQQSSKGKQVKEKNNASASEKPATNNKKKGKEKSSSNGTNSNNSQINNTNNNSAATNNNNNISSNINNNNNNSSNSNTGNGSNDDNSAISNTNNKNNNNNNNVNVADKHSESIGKDTKNKEKDKNAAGDKNSSENGSTNGKVPLPNNRSLYNNGKNNAIYSSSNLGKKSPTASKDPLPNGFIKLPENITINYESSLGDGKSMNDKESSEEIRNELLGDKENDRLTSGDSEIEKCLINGFQTDAVNGPFDKLVYNQRHGGYGYQNGGLNFSNNICQQNLFNNYMSMNKFGGQLKSDSSLLMDNNEAYFNQSNNHLIGQPSFLLKQQLAQQQQQQQQQQRNQSNIQQTILQQQNLYQQPQNQFSQDYRLIQQQQSQQPTLNGLHSQNQHFNYMQQSNLRDQLFLQQQQQKQLILNSYAPTGNSFIHVPNSDDMVIVDNVLSQHKFAEKSFGQSNPYSSEYKLKDNRKADEVGGEKCGLSMSGDDELGFDPFHETQKALADLMEKELLIQQNKQSLQHKNDQYFQPAQCYQNQHAFDGCQRGFNQLQVSMLNQQNNMMGGKVKLSLLSQIHSQQIVNSTSPKSSSGSNRLDGMRCSLPPPGFASPSHNGPPVTHLNNFGQGISRGGSRKIPQFLNLSNTESYQPHYVPNGVSKSDDWPESLRSLIQEGTNSSPTPVNSSYSSSPKGWSNLGNCSDWTALDPAIVSSSRSPHLSIHNQSLLSNNQGLSHLHPNHLQNQMRQLSIGSVLDHTNWSSSLRQSEDNWNAHIQTSVPPPGFALPHSGGELKKPVISGIEGLE